MAYSREKNGRWYACWVDPSGKQKSKACGFGAAGKKVARIIIAEVEAKLRLGTYNDKKDRSWKELIDEYKEKKLSNNRQSSQELAVTALEHFERIANPRQAIQVNESMVDNYILTRRQERGKQPGSKVSPATINRELRTLRAVLRVAKRWKYIVDVPEIEFLKEELFEPEFITPDQFVLLYQQCHLATLPCDLANGVTPEQFWKGLLMLLYMTGWRIEQTMQLKWENLDLETGMVFSPASMNKGRRDISCQLHPVVLDALQPIKNTFHDDVFPWSKSRGSLYLQFKLMQSATGVKPARKEWFGFHDLRRGFATANAANLDLFELQRLMQHKSLETTKRYVAMAHRSDTVLKLNVPDINRKHESG